MAVLIVVVAILLRPMFDCVWEHLQRGCISFTALRSGGVDLRAITPGALVVWVVAFIVQWLRAPWLLDRAPRSLTPKELHKISNYLRQQGKGISDKEIDFVRGYDNDFSAKLQTAFAIADWKTSTGLFVAGGDDTSGIWVHGKHRHFVQQAFLEAVAIAVKVNDDTNPNRTTAIMCGT